jgi:hypothetical protein
MSLILPAAAHAKLLGGSADASACGWGHRGQPR